MCTACTIQARIDGLPEPKEMEAMDTAELAEVQKEITDIYVEIATLDEDSKNELNLSKLTAASKVVTKGKTVIDEGSVIVKGWYWMIEKENDSHYILRIPGVTEGTPLPLGNKEEGTFSAIFGGISFSSATVNGKAILGGANSTALNNLSLIHI